MAEIHQNAPVTVGEWLHSKGLGQYENTFQEQGFDEIELLNEMTVEDIAACIPMRGHQAMFRRALRETFGDNTAVSQQLFGQRSGQTDRRILDRDSLMTSDLAATARGLEDVIGGLSVEGAGQLINNLDPNTIPQELRNTLRIMQGVSAISNWSMPSGIMTLLKPALARCSKENLKRCLLLGYPSARELVTAIFGWFKAILDKGYGWIIANWKDIAKITVLLIALLLLAYLVFGYFAVGSTTASVAEPALESAIPIVAGTPISTLPLATATASAVAENVTLTTWGLNQVTIGQGIIGQGVII